MPNPARSSAQTRFKVASWNIESLPGYITADAAPSLRDVLAYLGSPAALCLQEVRVRLGDSAMLTAMSLALSGYTCHRSLAADPKNATFRGGRTYGVATYVRSNLPLSRVISPDWDREGRILITEFQALGLALVNVYAVNGTDKPYFDHDLGRIDGDRHAFKRRFIRQLFELCQELTSRGFALILIGDWNISRTRLDTYPRLRTEEPHATARREFNDDFIPGLGLVDVYRHLHPEERKYTWFNKFARGGRLDAARVDFALISESLLASIVDADIDESKEARFKSDHAPLWIELTQMESAGWGDVRVTEASPLHL